MEGVDSRDDCPYHLSYSYLSAFAPPFTVNKSNSNVPSAPFMDLAESAVAITSNHYPFGFDFYSELDSTKPYGFAYKGPRAVDPRSAQLLHFGSPSEDAIKLSHYANSSAAPASNFGILPSLEGGSSFWPKETHISGLIPKDTFLNQADRDREDNNLSNSNKLYPVPISGSSDFFDCFDEDQLSVHQDSEPNSEMASSWNISRDVVDFVFRKTPRIENADAKVDNLSFKGSNSVEKFFDSVDQCNPAFDSPYWKGAPAAHFSLCEVSEALHREFMKMSDECYGSDLQGPHNFSLDTDTESDVLSSVDGVSERKIYGAPLNNSIFEQQSWSSYLKQMEVNYFVSPKIYIHELVKTMHNMSEVLLDHCMRDTCEMNEQYHNVLENVISNLRTCALKNAEEIIPTKKFGFPVSNSGKHDGESPKAQQNTSFEKPHLTAVGSEHASHTRGDDIEMKKSDKRAKAMKSILSENFRVEEELGSQALLYRNLWLDAEAELCSINDRARYNKMMIEMEKYSCKQTDNVEQSKLELDLKLRLSQSSAAEVNSFNFAKFSPESKEPIITSTLEGSGIQNEDSLFPDSGVFHRIEEAGDYEVSDINMPCINTGNLEGLRMVSQPFAVEPKLAYEGTEYHQKTRNEDCFSHDSPIPAKEPACDHEASSMSSEGSLEEFVFVGRLNVNTNSAAHNSDDLLSDWEHVEEEEFAGYTLKV